MKTTRAKRISTSLIDYLHHCRFAANYACDKLGWERIVCAEAGRPKSVEEISRLVFETACKYI